MKIFNSSDSSRLSARRLSALFFVNVQEFGLD